MADFSKDEQDYIYSLASALRNIEITEREMEDMRLLYKRTNGIPFDDFDNRNRPQGPTVKSSSTLGSKVKRAIGAPTSHCGMSIVGHSNDGSKWYMKDVFRAAIDQAKIFEPFPVVADELITWDEEEDEFDAEEEIIDEILHDESLTETEREQLIEARIGQGKFRSRVEIVSPACRVTGLTDVDFLVASHIKPWRLSTNEERLDGNNGLMLSPHIDHLFDQGYISFADDGALLVSLELPATVMTAWAIDVSVNAGKLADHQTRHMEFHRENIFLN